MLAKDITCSEFNRSFFRRKDRDSDDNDRVCSCHFPDGKKENGPEIFKWNEKELFPEDETKTPLAKTKQEVGNLRNEAETGMQEVSVT